MAMQTGWANRQLCHHCEVVAGDGFLKVPSIVSSSGRRDMENFKEKVLKPDSKSSFRSL